VIRPSILLSFSLVAAISLRAFARQQAVLIHDITVIDCTGAAPMEHMTVKIVGSRIVELRKSRPADAASAPVVIDGSGKFLIPGLSDMHVHLFNHISRRRPNTWYFPLFIANGVTSVREMWTKPSDMPAIRRWRSEFASGHSALPRILAVGTLLDGRTTTAANAAMALPGQDADVVTNRREAHERVKEIKRAHVDFIKTYSNLSREAYFALIKESRAAQLPVAGHVPFTVTADEASNAGQRTMEHLNQILETCSTDSQAIMQVPGPEWNSTWDARLADTYDRARCQSLFALLAKNHTWQVPTLVRQREHYFTGNARAYTEDDRLKYVPNEEKKRWHAFVEKRRALSVEEEKADDRLWQINEGVISDMARAGVPLMTGTDLGNEFIFPGFSVHDELALLVEAGLSPMQALEAATRQPAECVGKLGEMGTIASGKIADLVILTANPLLNIRNTQKIETVIINGRVFSHQQIEEILRTAIQYSESLIF
jgi:imidazolonepropionase-like amidohydrolase